MEKDLNINADFINATHRAVYNTPTEEHPYHMIYIINDKDVPTKALRFDKTSETFNNLKDRERVMVTIGAPLEDGSLDFNIQQLS